MNTYTLNGIWEYRIGAGEWEKRSVPFSALAVGHSECKRYFDLPASGERVMLRFEGITYAASVHLNGKKLGEMYPYCEYLFDITDCVREKENELLVELEDLSPAFGPSAGWENYGGIIRPVSLLVGARARLENCFFCADLSADFSRADYTVEAKTEEAEGCFVAVTLTDGEGKVADAYRFAVGKTPVRRIESPLLWSPDAPNLYRLSVSLEKDGSELDRYETSVGFRSFTCDRHRFYLNGTPTFLLGVCRHEMIGPGGHCPTYGAIEAELRRIKEAGCNFVRLVHYPHCKETLEIAARIGLMVSEEPGLWGCDTADPDLARGSLEVLARTVLRDRNSPSIVFWLAFNECRFSESYLRDARATVLAYDKTRMISGANDKGDEETYGFFNLCGFDFYTTHPYSPTFDRARASARALHDKPLLLSEWGGYFVYDNPHLLSDFIREIAALWHNPSDDGAIAGAFFWFWREVYDGNRGAPACRDGILSEALVDYEGNPTPIYRAYFDTWAEVLGRTEKPEPYEYTAAAEQGGTPLTPEGENGFFDLLSRMREDIDVLRGPLKHNAWRRRRLEKGPRLVGEPPSGISPVPFVVRPDSPLVFRGRAEGKTLSVIGMTAALSGYPLKGAYGEEVARLTVFYENGKSETFPLRNGYELTTVYTTVGSSRINPRAVRATPFAYFSHDKNHENYIINRLALPLANSPVTRVEIAQTGADCGLLIYGIFVE